MNHLIDSIVSKQGCQGFATQSQGGFGNFFSFQQVRDKDTLLGVLVFELDFDRPWDDGALPDDSWWPSEDLRELSAELQAKQHVARDPSELHHLRALLFGGEVSESFLYRMPGAQLNPAIRKSDYIVLAEELATLDVLEKKSENIRPPQVVVDRKLKCMTPLQEAFIDLGDTLRGLKLGASIIPFGSRIFAQSIAGEPHLPLVEVASNGCSSDLQSVFRGAGRIVTASEIADLCRFLDVGSYLESPKRVFSRSGIFAETLARCLEANKLCLYLQPLRVAAYLG
jgi:hypothetical protein